jgi:hypothetical protein
MTQEIVLKGGLVALVDDEDFERLAGHKWHAKVYRRAVYAVRRDRHDGRRRSILMHRELLGVPPGRETDHTDHNGLNNQRTNLRECTHQQNGHNRRSNLGSSSKLKGVCWNKRLQKWEAQILTNGRKCHLGVFLDEVEAAEAYKTAAAIAFGDFAAGDSADGPLTIGHPLQVELVSYRS